MNLWFEHDGRRFYRAAIREAAEFHAPTDDRGSYACLLWSHAPFIEAERWRLANALVDGGCRYAVCGGIDNEALHDDIDSAYIRPIVEQRSEGTNRALVMTTWHDDEPAEEVAFFFTHSAFSEDGGEFTVFVVLQLGGTPEQHAALDEAVRQSEILPPAV